jgi:hypothetical protein
MSHSHTLVWTKALIDLQKRKKEDKIPENFRFSCSVCSCVQCGPRLYRPGGSPRSALGLNPCSPLALGSSSSAALLQEALPTTSPNPHYADKKLHKCNSSKKSPQIEAFKIFESI